MEKRKSRLPELRSPLGSCRRFATSRLNGRALTCPPCERVHGDAQALVELGLLECTEKGALHCPFVDIYVDMHIITPVKQAA